VRYIDHLIDDGDSDGNGRLDPGEEVGLILSLRNFGAPAEDVRLTITTDDPYILVVDGTAEYGDLAPGEIATNAGDPLILLAPALARIGHIADFTAVATFTGGQAVSTFRVCIGKFSFLVWDPTGDQSSGPVLFETLQALGYEGGYRQSIEYTDLDLYASLFVSLGVYPNAFRVAYDAPEATAITSYLAQGGCVYLEGGDVWVYDTQNGGFDFGPAFKILPVADGNPDLVTVKGRSATFTQGMRFDYQGENEYIDRINRTGAGVIVFESESPWYITGVAYNSGVYRTIGTSFEFAGLTDGEPPSTREALARAMIEYFIPPQTQAAPLPPRRGASGIALAPPGPQPAPGTALLRFSLPSETALDVGLFDPQGRRLRTLARGPHARGEHALALTRGDLAAGVYFVRLRAGETSIARRVVWAE